MKKTIFTVAMLIAVMSIKAQTAFVGGSVNSLIGVNVKVIERAESLQQYGYMEFYTDPSGKYGSTYKKGIYNTPYEALVSKEFKVVRVAEGKFYGNKMLVLFNPETDTLFYDYSIRYEHACRLDLVSIPEGFYCSQIKVEEDKFSNKTTLRTGLLEGVSFTKIIDESGTRIYMSLGAYGSTLNVGISGVKVLLDNGDVLNFDVKVDANSGKGSGWEYSAFILLNDQDIKVLTQHSITDFRLYIHDRTVKDGNKFKELLKCLVTQ